MSRTYRLCVATAAWVVVVGSAALLPGVARAAETVHLYLKANGVSIQGEPTQTSLGRENSIECVQFTHEVATPVETGSGLAMGRRVYQPIVIRKRIDKSSPLLMKALALNQTLEAEFRFFRPNPIGDGTTEQFFTIRLSKARIVGVKLFLPNCLDPAASNYPPQEDVSIAFQGISWTYTNGNVTFDDSGKLMRDADESGIQERGVGQAPKK